MKFSYTLIKQLVPQVKNKQILIEKLNSYSFESSDLLGDVFDISVPVNRYSDAACHWGIAREISAILGISFRTQSLLKGLSDKENDDLHTRAPLQIKVEDKNLCPRYRAHYFDNVVVKPSPKWMQKILRDCGLRPINNVVDIMNYAMLESGQPLHAFDFDELGRGDSKIKTIIVRRAKAKEKIRTLDGKDYDLDSDILLIADDYNPIALAGIKGGKHAEISQKTKRIVVEAANFNAVNIYQSSRRLRLATDASQRFSHAISPELVPIGLRRAAELLSGIAMAKSRGFVEVNYTKPRKKIIKFDLLKFVKFIGAEFDLKNIRRSLRLLGFEIKVPATALSHYPAAEFLVEVPQLRNDIETPEDLAEEIARLHGYNHLKSIPPKVHLIPSGFEDQITLADSIKRVLTILGFSEVYNHSFIGEKDLMRSGGFKDRIVELLNPLSAETKYLRPNLSLHLTANIESNFRFHGALKIFEIGDVFTRGKNQKVLEESHLAAAVASKNQEPFFELKGVTESSLKRLGLVDFRMVPCDSGVCLQILPTGELADKSSLKIMSGKVCLGCLARVRESGLKGYAAIAEINLGELIKLVSAEREYQPLPKYPSVMRDLSLSLEGGGRVGDIMQAIQESNLKEVADVDLIDEYKNSFTFRIVFQAEDRTLTDKEVNKKMERISSLLVKKFGARIR